MSLNRLEKSPKNNSQLAIQKYPLIISVDCSKEEITAFLEDGRKVSIPTAWYPRTRKATLKQLKNFRISSDKYGIHWPEIDEHLSVRAFLKGLGS
ncbi:MAG: DUF2442 domain-containing protein [Candidatus Moeniiplasma glomeromycotorum]|nr:DUF2442 domain-containing protein [Candidatus Moeniiplasma glomeromycotorum]MCE8167186.1 DUF2442 domain-containing protein [Candidatus Moeniiplasma glomeromycotorum]MCE8168802.1 DUF2442 domain-containing protein [Candidatus Moeniiplasma glomeromycotorum]